jgi:integrase/recombinase XerD
MRESRPYFRAFDGWWYIQIRVGAKRRQVKLAKGKSNRQPAHDRWHELMAHKRKPERIVATVDSDSVKAALDCFLVFVHREQAATTAAWYQNFLDSFAETIPDTLSVDALVPGHVTEWLATKPKWSKSTKSCAVRAIRRAFRWLTDEGKIRGYPLRGLKASRQKHREVVVSPETFKAILEASDESFGRLLRFIRATGCRPQEARTIEKRHVDLTLRRIVFAVSESKGQEHPRVIYLNDEAHAIIQELSRKHPTGMLFLNSRDKPWTRNAIRCRFRRLDEAVGGRFCAYHLRHTFATESLKRMDAVAVSVLMGHSDPATLLRNYQHLAQDPAYMLSLAKKATPESTPAP